MDGVKNFTAFMYENWTTILICIGMVAGIIKKTKWYLSKSDEERIAIVKKTISASMLKMITDAEIDFADMEKAGAIKRSQVIKQIYSEYPILSKISDQEKFIKWVDTEINNSLKTLREIVKQNNEVR